MSKKRTILWCIGLLLLAVCMAGIWHMEKGAGTEGEKTFTLTVQHGDGSVISTTIVTDSVYLREPLEKEGLIKGEERAYGLFVMEVDGERARPELQQWWRLTKDGDALSTGVDQTPVEDGGQYEFALVTGW